MVLNNVIVDVTISQRSFVFDQLRAEVSAGFTNVLSSLADLAFDLVYCSPTLPTLLFGGDLKSVVYVSLLQQKMFWSACVLKFRCA